MVFFQNFIGVAVGLLELDRDEAVAEALAQELEPLGGDQRIAGEAQAEHLQALARAPVRDKHGKAVHLAKGGSDELGDLNAQDGAVALRRRLHRYVKPALLVIDEFGYLPYSNRYADLLFEVVTQRYMKAPIVITTNRPFSEWSAVFQSATCVGTLLDRLCHRVEIVQIAGESWRLKESMERSARPRTRPPRNPT